MTAIRRSRLCAAVLAALLPATLPAMAQDAGTTAPATDTSKAKVLDRITVTGSRIKQTNKVTDAPVAIITRDVLDKSGATSVGDFLQELTASGKALNAKFNSSGNFGYPPDGGGIGAGSAQVDLRNLGSNRVLVLVDGIRWVNESSGSGVSNSADLNTIPLAIVDRIEVLEDGASAIYGSDAIAGVVNIITKKNFDGALVHEKYGSYGHGGNDEEADVTFGGHSDRFSGVFNASYVKQDGISSAVWAQAAGAAVPGGGVGSGSSATPQGRATFCDPRLGGVGFCADGDNWFDITLNDGATPNYNGGDPTDGPGTYHNWSGADRFNYAPYNLLLTPNERKSVFGSGTYDISDSVQLHGKFLYNNRTSSNEAAPEPIFAGPFTGSGGLADTIDIAANNPYNPTCTTPGVVSTCLTLSGAPPTDANGDPLPGYGVLGWFTKRPLELGPRIFNQDVNTWYANLGLTGSLNWGPRGADWNIDYVHSENSADQVFTGGFNLANLKLSLGDVNVCNATPGCVPLDLFGGQTRPITPAMLAFVTATQHDSTKQTLDLVTANLTGDLWSMGDNRYAGFAIGYEHRRYGGDFNPDPLRQNGDSQDSQAEPVSASYSVDEGYAELQTPWLKEFSTDFAVRYSNYSTFGGATTGKAGFRWQPIEDFVLRGTYSQGFRAPSIGELFGLTQFGPTLFDPCNNLVAGSAVYDYCHGQGVPVGFQQANTQVVSITGGNPNLKPEKSKNFNLGAVWSPSWADNLSWSKKLDFEADYFHYKVSNAIQAPDIQARINGCATGDITGAACAIFVRPPAGGGNLGPIQDTLANFGSIKTNGIDLKANWTGPQMSWGTPSITMQATHTISYQALDEFDLATSRTVGVETDNGAIPSWAANVQFGWAMGDWSASWNLRYIDSVTEDCSIVQSTNDYCAHDVQGNNIGTHHLGSTTYSDVQLAWDNAFGAKGLKLDLGANNVFARNPPVCVTCTLNGYDAGTYDLPFRFVYAEVNWKF
ncbi:MAG TPA: TonB-dependent receptor [Xanthomonadaceae bacterium]|jgi:iron complex outermembrane receptor protein